MFISDADEDDQLAAAIAASLKETTQSTSKVLGTNSDSDDSDSEFFEESFSAENSNSASTLPSFSSKNYAKLVESAKSKLIYLLLSFDYKIRMNLFGYGVSIFGPKILWHTFFFFKFRPFSFHFECMKTRGHVEHPTIYMYFCLFFQLKPTPKSNRKKVTKILRIGKFI